MAWLGMDRDVVCWGKWKSCGWGKWKSPVKREIPAEACGKQFPMLKAAGQQGSGHLHIRDIQLHRTPSAHDYNYSKILEQLANEIIVQICRVGLSFMAFPFCNSEIIFIIL